jgi:hypothetical protein
MSIAYIAKKQNLMALEKRKTVIVDALCAIIDSKINTVLGTPCISPEFFKSPNGRILPSGSTPARDDNQPFWSILSLTTC